MKVIHVIHGDPKFAHTITEVINDNCDVMEHDIVYLPFRNGNSLINPNFKLTQYEYYIHNGYDLANMIKVVKKCEFYDYVIFHSLFFHALLKLLFYLNRNVKKKMVWIGFGGDLYLHGKSHIDLSQRMTRLIARNVRLFIGVVPMDCNYYKKIYPNSKACTIYAPYINPNTSIMWRERCGTKNEVKKRVKDEIRLLVGHSATNEIMHFETLKLLSKFRDRNIKIFIPLSYGDTKYADKVEMEARAIFDKKAICLRKFMPINEYVHFLSTIDAGIFYTYRQIGMSNIYPLMCMGCRIYMPRESEIFRFLSHEGLNIRAVEDISNMAISDMVYPVSDKMERNISRYYERYISPDAIINGWNKAFSHLRSRGSGLNERYREAP